MPFEQGPILTYLGRGAYLTAGPTVYVGRDQVLTIPGGFQTDLASVPRIFWPLLPPDGAYEDAAVLHDWLCTELARARAGGPAAPVTARDTDGLFRRVMREARVGFVTRWIMWMGVRWGAATNPARRPGWWRDSPTILAITALLIAVLVLGVVAVHELVDVALALLL